MHSAVTTTPLTKDIAVSISRSLQVLPSSTLSAVITDGATNLSFWRYRHYGFIRSIERNPSTTSYLRSPLAPITMKRSRFQIQRQAPTMFRQSSCCWLRASASYPGSPGQRPHLWRPCEPWRHGDQTRPLTFTINVPAGRAGLKRGFKTSGGTGDTDIYAKFGAAPTTASYDANPMVSTICRNVTISAPKAGTYYVLVKTYAASNGATITACFTVSVS